MDDLLAALNKAAGLLPEGYTIALNVEKDAGWVVLYGLDEKDDLPLDGESLVEQVNNAIELALQDATKEVK